MLDVDQNQLTSPWAKAVDALAPLMEFTVHVIVGATLFVIIAIPAILLNMGVHWAEDHHFGELGLLLILRGLEYFLLSLDAILFMCLLIKKAYRAVKEMK